MGKKRGNDVLLFVVLLVLTIIGMIYSTILFVNSFDDGKEIEIAYNEYSNLGYKVWLIDNKFYSSEYLDENYNVVSSSIKEIEIDFSYLLDFSKYVTGTSYYTIDATIVAHQRGDVSERKIWDYNEIIKDKVITVYDTDALNVEHADNFKIDYIKFKKMMDDYKKNYGVSLVGNLIVEVNIKNDFNYSGFQESIDLNKRSMTVVIPLTETIVNISKNKIEDNSQILIEKGESSINYLKLILSVFAICLGLGLCVYLGLILVKLMGVDSKYTKELNKILKTYGAVIVNVNEIKIDSDLNSMQVSSFYELLDAQQELKKPILFWNIKPNKKAMFAIKYENDMLIYNINSTLYDNKAKKKSDVK